MHIRKMRMLLVCVALGGACTLAGCSSTGSPAVGSTSTDQQLLDLTKQYETGAISKEQYERDSASLRSRRDRELIQSGSPMNETVRGVLSAP
jgi:hypothetical protein